MPRVGFISKEQLLKWVKKHCKPEQYEAWITPDKEIIFAPTKSTRSLRYGYLSSVTRFWNDFKEAKEEILKAQPGIDIFMGPFDWDSSRPPGVERRG